MLGATGSIGESTLDLVGRDPDAYEVIALTGCKNATRLAELAIKHRAKLAVVADPDCYADLQEALVGSGIAAAFTPSSSTSPGIPASSPWVYWSRY